MLKLYDYAVCQGALPVFALRQHMLTSFDVSLSAVQVLKTYKTGRFVQSAAMSPLFDHVRHLMSWFTCHASLAEVLWMLFVAARYCPR